MQGISFPETTELSLWRQQKPKPNPEKDNLEAPTPRTWSEAQWAADLPGDF